MIIQFFNQLGGANTNLSPMFQPPNMPKVLNGCNPTWKLGALMKDTGYKKIGSALQANKKILGLHHGRQTPSLQNVYACVNDSGDDDTQLFYSTGGAWTEITAAETAWANEANGNIEMEDFIGYTFIVGHDSTDGWLPVASVTNTTFSTSTNVTNMPNAKYITRYRDRLYVGNCFETSDRPYRVYYSSVPTAGAITWTVASDFIDVDYSEQITGMASMWDMLLIFNQNSTYFYDQSQKKKIWDIGGYHRTIAKHAGYIYFSNRDGLWRSAGGNQPENVSGNVIDFYRNGTPSSMFGEIVDEEYHIYFGDSVTVDGVTYSNVVGTFNIPTQSWRWRELADAQRVFEKYIDSNGEAHLWMGASTTGTVYEKGKYTDATLLSDDDGDPIGSNFELAPFYVGNLSFEKKVAKINAYADRAMGLKLKMRILDRNTRALTEYMPLGELTKYINTFDVMLRDGVLIQIAGSEYGSREYWSFFGLELEADNESEILKQPE